MAAAGRGRWEIPHVKSGGALNPAIILTKYKGLRDYEEQLTEISVGVISRDPGRKCVGIAESGMSAKQGYEHSEQRAVSWAGVQDSTSPSECAAMKVGWQSENVFEEWAAKSKECRGHGEASTKHLCSVPNPWS